MPWNDGDVANLRNDKYDPNYFSFGRLAGRRKYAFGKMRMPLIAALGLIVFGGTYIYAALLIL